MRDRDRWEKLFVEDGMSLIDMSRLPGAPSYHTLRQWSSQDSWRLSRRRYLEGTAQDVSEKAAARVEAVDFAPEEPVEGGDDLESRHRKIFRYAQKLALAKLSTISPEALSVKEAVNLLTWAMQGEKELPRVQDTGEWSVESLQVIAQRIYGIPLPACSPPVSVGGNPEPQ